MAEQDYDLIVIGAGPGRLCRGDPCGAIRAENGLRGKRARRWAVHVSTSVAFRQKRCSTRLKCITRRIRVHSPNSVSTSLALG